MEQFSENTAIREKIREYYLVDEYKVITELISLADLSQSDRQEISDNAAELIRAVRENSKPSMMEKFLAEYGLTTKEGVALMCLAEALLRVPDSATIDALIQDKVATGQWGPHLGKSGSSLINSATWALLITGKIIAPVDEQNLTDTLRSMMKRLGEPVVRVAVAQAMKELGRQFVLGRTIREATKLAKKEEGRGYTHSYDMLGEAARTDADAQKYHTAYSKAISELADSCIHKDIRQNPGISVKLSALHARYEFAKYDRVMTELVDRTRILALQAKEANMGFNIDAEEADRLDISLDVIEAVLSDPGLQGWHGFGVVVQTFSPRASHVIDWLHALATRLDRKIMVRLVKGAYWDAEIKRAQILGLDGFPVFTRKANSDISYIACAKKLMAMRDRIYPQFATHNAHSVAAILHLTQDRDGFEFQRLHGMGESLHDAVVKREKAHCRIYAPVGAHQDLLAYLVRRLLENGANSSFVNQIVDKNIAPETIAEDPLTKVENLGLQVSSQAIVRSENLFSKQRKNSKGWDITDTDTVTALQAEMQVFQTQTWHAEPLTANSDNADSTASTDGKSESLEIYNPAMPEDRVGSVRTATPQDISSAINSARSGFISWSETSATKRASCIQRVGELYEEHAAELFVLATREAGKTLLDGIGEVREAADFAYFYANEALEKDNLGQGRGIITCISPWNFPLAIFSGQILAALAAGNVVLAKPADQTPLIAFRAIQLMHEAGIPTDAVQLLPGSGLNVGVPLTSEPSISGICFTGSTQTAQRINQVMAKSMPPQAPFVAETGGLNAMIVDSTALPEQVVRDVIASSFQSAGQRCSALRMLYVQEDIADHLFDMLFGAMDELQIGNPALLSTDVGPVIDIAAKTTIDHHCNIFQKSGQVLKTLATPEKGLFVSPTVIKVNGIHELEKEIFGPVLHVATFKSSEIDQVIDAINNKGYGLTFGLHTRVDGRVEQIISRINVGNIYVNRNQIGAVVGSQPFGGEGLSGTGPKAGGPQYVPRFINVEPPQLLEAPTGNPILLSVLQEAINQVSTLDWQSWAGLTGRMNVINEYLYESDGDAEFYQPGSEDMPGPTGELNRLSTVPRGIVLCLGPDDATALKQARIALSQGNAVVMISPNAESVFVKARKAGVPVVGLNGAISAHDLKDVEGIHAIASLAHTEVLKSYRIALANRSGALLPLITELQCPERYTTERHLCVDTTAAGGNASLIAASE